MREQSQERKTETKDIEIMTTKEQEGGETCTGDNQDIGVLERIRLAWIPSQEEGEWHFIDNTRITKCAHHRRHHPEEEDNSKADNMVQRQPAKL